METIQSHCPTGSNPLLKSWFSNRQVIIRISRDRVSKLGDYRPAQNGLPARISINQGLNPIEFLITLVHELAHQDTLKIKRPTTVRFRPVRLKYGVKPHGEEWKAAFRGYIGEIILSGILGQNICNALRTCYLERERIASSPCSEMKALMDGAQEEALNRVQNIKEGEVFELRKGRLFVRGPKLRTRYRCKEVATGRMFTIHALATVIKNQD